MLRLEELRKIHKYSQNDIALMLKTTNQTISNWEKGKTEPGIEHLKRLASIFNVSIDYLVGYNIKDKSVSDIKVKFQTLSKEDLIKSLEEILSTLDKDQ